MDRSLLPVTHEDQPLARFGQAASEEVHTLLSERGVTILNAPKATMFDGEHLTLIPPPPLRAERVVTLPKLTGDPIEGVPRDAVGFVPVDQFGCVPSLPGTGLLDVRRQVNPKACSLALMISRTSERNVGGGARSTPAER